jgi:hypothetical protein
MDAWAIDGALDLLEYFDSGALNVGQAATRLDYAPGGRGK